MDRDTRLQMNRIVTDGRNWSRRFTRRLNDVDESITGTDEVAIRSRRSRGKARTWHLDQRGTDRKGLTSEGQARLFATAQANLRDAVLHIDRLTAALSLALTDVDEYDEHFRIEHLISEDTTEPEPAPADNDQQTTLHVGSDTTPAMMGAFADIGKRMGEVVERVRVEWAESLRIWTERDDGEYFIPHTPASRARYLRRELDQLAKRSADLREEIVDTERQVQEQRAELETLTRPPADEPSTRFNTATSGFVTTNCQFFDGQDPIDEETPPNCEAVEPASGVRCMVQAGHTPPHQYVSSDGKTGVDWEDELCGDDSSGISGSPCTEPAGHEGGHAHTDADGKGHGWPAADDPAGKPFDDVPPALAAALDSARELVTNIARAVGRPGSVCVVIGSEEHIRRISRGSAPTPQTIERREAARREEEQAHTMLVSRLQRYVEHTYAHTTADHEDRYPANVVRTFLTGAGFECAEMPDEGQVEQEEIRASAMRGECGDRSPDGHLRCTLIAGHDGVHEWSDGVRSAGWPARCWTRDVNLGTQCCRDEGHDGAHRYRREDDPVPPIRCRQRQYGPSAGGRQCVLDSGHAGGCRWPENNGGGSDPAPEPLLDPKRPERCDETSTGSFLGVYRCTLDVGHQSPHLFGGERTGLRPGKRMTGSTIRTSAATVPACSHLWNADKGTAVPCCLPAGHVGDHEMITFGDDPVPASEPRTYLCGLRITQEDASVVECGKTIGHVGEHGSFGQDVGEFEPPTLHLHVTSYGMRSPDGMLHWDATDDEGLPYRLEAEGNRFMAMRPSEYRETLVLDWGRAEYDESDGFTRIRLTGEEVAAMTRNRERDREQQGEEWTPIPLPRITTGTTYRDEEHARSLLLLQLSPEVPDEVLKAADAAAKTVGDAARGIGYPAAVVVHVFPKDRVTVAQVTNVELPEPKPAHVMAKVAETGEEDPADGELTGLGDAMAAANAVGGGLERVSPLGRELCRHLHPTDVYVLQCVEDGGHDGPHRSTRGSVDGPPVAWPQEDATPPASVPHNWSASPEIPRGMMVGAGVAQDSERCEATSGANRCRFVDGHAGDHDLIPTKRSDGKGSEILPGSCPRRIWNGQGQLGLQCRHDAGHEGEHDLVPVKS